MHEQILMGRLGFFLINGYCLDVCTLYFLVRSQFLQFKLELLGKLIFRQLTREDMKSSPMSSA